MSELTPKPLQIWSCKIGECPEASLPIAADSPMRDAVAEAYTRITGHAPTFIFSGWNDDLTEEERAVHEDRIPNDCPPTRWSDEYVSDLQHQITQQAQELERAKEQLRRYNHWTPEHTIEEWLADRQRIVDAKEAEADVGLQQQLSASQARCRDMEREIETLTTCGCEGCDDNLEESAFCFPCMNKVQQQVTQLQATLAALEAGRLKEAADSLTCEVCKMGMQRAMKVSK